MAARPEDYPLAVQRRLERLRKVTQRIESDGAERLELVRTLRTEDGVVAALIAEASGVTESMIFQTVRALEKGAAAAR